MEIGIPHNKKICRLLSCKSPFELAQYRLRKEKPGRSNKRINDVANKAVEIEGKVIVVC